MTKNLIAIAVLLIILVALLFVVFRGCGGEPELTEPTVTTVTRTVTNIDTIYVPQERVVYRNLYIPQGRDTVIITRTPQGLESPPIPAQVYTLAHRDSLLDAWIDVTTTGKIMNWDLTYNARFPTILRTDSIFTETTIRRGQPRFGLGVEARATYIPDQPALISAGPFLALRNGRTEIRYLPQFTTQGSLTHSISATYTLR